jgi:integrase
VLSPEQLADVLASVVGKGFLPVRDRALIMLLVESGVRRAEAADLNVSDLDLMRRGGGTVHVRCGKHGSDRHSEPGTELRERFPREVPTRDFRSACSTNSRQSARGLKITTTLGPGWSSSPGPAWYSREAHNPSSPAHPAQR